MHTLHCYADNVPWPEVTRISCVVEMNTFTEQEGSSPPAITSHGYLIILISHSNLCMPNAKTKPSLLPTTSDIYNLCPPIGTTDMTTLSCDCIDDMDFLFFISCSMTKQLHVYHPPSHLPYAHTHAHLYCNTHAHKDALYCLGHRGV